jgi:hypothetical protein
VPTIIALIFAMMIIVLNENSREMINNWRSKDDCDEDEFYEDVLEGEVLEAVVLNEMPTLPSFPNPIQNVAPLVQPSLDLGEEVFEAEVVEAEVVEAEVVIDPLEVEFVEAEVEDDELDAFLDDF